MAIEINNNTILRLIVRRGTNDDRQLSTLAAGELAFTVDTQRLFVGVDGQVGTGVVAGNKFLGVVTNRSLANSIAQIGDTVFDSNASALFALTAAGAWASVSTAFGTGFAVNAGVMGLDPVYWSIVPSSRSLQVSGSVYSKSNTCNVYLSAGNRDTSIYFTNSAGYSYINAASAFKIQANSPTSSDVRNVSSFPGFDFSGGCGYFRNGLIVDGDCVIKGNTYQNATTNLSVTAINIDTTTSPTLTALHIFNNSGSPNPVLVQIASNNHNSLFIDCHPFVGIHTTNVATYGGTYWTVISGNTLQAGNLTVQGDLTATGDIVGLFSSDTALKENISPITNALEKLLALKGVEFDWNEKSIYEGHDIGVLAQDVERVIPSAVKERYDGYKGVQYEKIIPLIIEAIRELKSSK